MSSLQQYLDLYGEHRALLEAGSCEALNARRAEAAEFLSRRELPTTRVERYKYTSAEEAFAPDFGLNLRRILPVADPCATYHCSVPELETIVMYVVNDVVVPLHDKTQLPEGVEILTFAQAARQCPERLAQYYHRAAAQEPPPAHKNTEHIDRDVVTQLNTLLVQDGILLYIAPGVALDRTLQIVFTSASRHNLMSNRRLLVIAEADSRADLLICEHADDRRDFLTTQVTEIYAAPRAAVHLYTLEETQSRNRRFSNIYVEQQTDSRVAIHNIALVTGLSRTAINARLMGTGADCQTTGAVIADGRQHVDNTLLVDHLAEGCTSDMLYKYVLDGESTAVFAGKVLVRPGAQRTLSHQNSANICISPDATVHSLPMLEIYADDVKCNHGSTVGKLDDGALLYLRQRGIPLPEARLLLQHAFINDVLQRVEIPPLRERLSKLVELRFRGELHHCKGCRLG